MNPIIKLIANAQPGEKKFVLFAGAGVSKDAEVPTAWDLMLKTASLLYAAENNEIKEGVNYEEWFLNSNYAKMSYSELIKELYPKYPAQQDFLQQYLGSKKPGKVHELIAELARREIIRAIITTNFDHYIEDALKEKGLDIQVISTEEDLTNSEPLIQCKKVRIYKPHGDLGKGKLRNTPVDLERLPQQIEDELVRVLSEHGVMVLGYSGRDKDMQRVFEKRNYNYYQLFWINPKPPEGEMKNILESKGYEYIECTGASQFLEYFFDLLERVDEIAPTIGSGPTIVDLENALSSNEKVAAARFSDFLERIFKDLEQTKPDFSKFEEIDDAIVDQIQRGLQISYDFISAGLLAAKYDNLEVIKTIYNYFGNFLKLYEPPTASTYRPIDYDGFKFLTYEMFVSFIAGLIKYERWEAIDNVLSEDLFVDKVYDSSYKSFVRVSESMQSLDEIRNKRLLLKRVSVVADFIKSRFSESKLSKLVTFKEFVEADYFLFVRSVCNLENTNDFYNIWYPQSFVYLNWVPRYIVMAESKAFLDKLSKAIGFDNNKDFIIKLRERHSLIVKYAEIPASFTDPLWNYDFGKLGSRK
jgi:predicted CopG family antitoxin